MRILSRNIPGQVGIIVFSSIPIAYNVLFCLFCQTLSELKFIPDLQSLIFKTSLNGIITYMLCIVMAIISKNISKGFITSLVIILLVTNLALFFRYFIMMREERLLVAVLWYSLSLTVSNFIPGAIIEKYSK